MTRNCRSLFALAKPLAAVALFGFVLTGCGAMHHVGEVMSGNTADVAVRKITESPRPDDRREGMLYLTDHDYGLKEPYTKFYRDIAEKDPDPLVRATALRSLNRARDKQATPLFIKALSDPSPLVRLEGAKALYRVPDPAAADKLLAMAMSAEENKDVRIAAAEALQYYRRIDIGRQLVSLLNQRDFGIAWQARRTLKRLTGKDLNYDEAAWLQYITGPSKPLG